MNYSKHCERYTLRDLAAGILRTDPETGAALMPRPLTIRDFADAFTQALLPQTAGLQRVPVVSGGHSGHGTARFLCDCGRKTVVLYRPKDAERFACVRCARITYTRPPSLDAAHRRYVQALIEAHGRDAVVEMARRGLAERLERASAQGIAAGKSPGLAK